MTYIKDWETFVRSSRNFFDANRGSQIFQLIRKLDELYRVAHRKAPFSKTGGEGDDLFRKCFVTCHWALLSAATNTGSGLPEDGPAMIRRAFEAAKVCLAVKAHPDNFEAWKATEENVGRREYQARSQNLSILDTKVSPRTHSTKKFRASSGYSRTPQCISLPSISVCTNGIKY